MFFKKIKLSRAVDRVIEDRFYEQVAIEMSNNEINLGTWTRAKANANGDKGKTEALYIKYRVQALHDTVNAVEVLTDLNSNEVHKSSYIDHDNRITDKEKELARKKADKLKKEREEKELARKQADRLKKYPKTLLKEITPFLHKYKHHNIGNTNDLSSLEDHFLLHTAVMMSDTKLVSILLEAGFDPKMKNQKGYTAIELTVCDAEMKKIFENSAKKTEDTDKSVTIHKEITGNEVNHGCRKKVLYAAISVTIVAFAIQPHNYGNGFDFFMFFIFIFFFAQIFRD
jgi:hypothetical protein